MVQNGLHKFETKFKDAGINLPVYTFFAGDDGRTDNILYVVAFVQGICAALMNFHEDPLFKRIYSFILIGILVVFDTFLKNYPKSVDDSIVYSNEVM